VINLPVGKENTTNMLESTLEEITTINLSVRVNGTQSTRPLLLIHKTNIVGSFVYT
jgi:hypothetical protein